MKTPRDPFYNYEGGTWLESESFCYPNGGMKRRACVRFPDGKLRIVRCGISDTFFSIPVHKSDGDGFLTVADDGALEFIKHTKPDVKDVR